MAAPAATKFDVGGVLLDQPFKVRRLGHFGLNTAHWDESIHFWVDLLGFRLSEEGRGFMHFGGDHHAFNLGRRRTEAEQSTQGRREAADNDINQMSWQTQSVSEPVNAIDYFEEREIEVVKIGRDGAGSNWATYFLDPDRHRNELFYGMEQIGWDGHSKPAEYRRPRNEKIQLPVMSELGEIQESLATGVPVTTGYRYVESMPATYDVGGILLPRPFKAVRHGPVNLFVSDVDRAREFYVNEVGFRVTEEVSWEGGKCVFLRCSTEHHSLGLFPKSWRARLGLSPDTTCMSFGVQVANYQQLKAAVSFLREHGVRVETAAIPPELYPGIDFAAHAFDPDGHCIQLYYYMEQVGWDGAPRPTSTRRQVDPQHWPDTLEPLSDTFTGEPFLGPWG
jgi:catechol 2,3-dioxygenase-like lactoylglutathione lyase family enzyme